MSPLFDTHAHYYDARFYSDECPAGVNALLDGLFSSHTVARIVNVGTDIETTKLAIAQAQKYQEMFVAAGIHPTDAMHLSSLEESINALQALVENKQNKIVAIGEIGLDYHYPDTDKSRQFAWFDAQLALAEKCGLPVVIHDREAHGDCVEMIKRHKTVRGVFHSYSGSLETANQLLSLGYYISFSGTLTFTNARKVAEVAAAMPHDRVLIETDCPYLAPHPHRGSINHSGYLPLTAQKLGEVWGISVEETANITFDNANRFFSLS